MSNLIVPRYTLHYLRAEFPGEWGYLQYQIDKVLENPPPLIAAAMEELGREGARERIERLLDLGILLFMPIPGRKGHFGLLLYCPQADRYMAYAQDGTLHPLEQTCWEESEADDE